MSAVRIVTRTTKKGFARYIVYYRRGGQGFPEEYAGSFHFAKEAKIRRDVVAGELAAGRDPRTLLEQIKLPPKPKPGLELAYCEFMAARVDVGPSTARLYHNSRDWWLPLLGRNADPGQITVANIVAGINEMLEDLAASTIGIYLSHLAMVLDHVDVAPNPARSKKIRLPNQGGAEKEIPSNEEWALIQSKLKERSRLAVRLMECCGLRVSEACGIEAGDLDASSGQILIRRTVTKTPAGRRWVPCPPELLDPLVERGGVGVSKSQAYYDLVLACEKAKVREFGTHALRHRRISLWLRQGVDAVQVSRWAGHAKASMSTDTYGHTVVDAYTEEWFGFWGGVYGRSPNAAPVRHQEVTDA